MKNMEHRKNALLVAIGILVVAALVSWWIVARQPLFSTTDQAQQASSTAGTSSHSSSTKPKGGAPAITKVNRANQTVSQVVAGLSSGTLFNSLYKSTGVSALISANGTYTVFVPTNGAFNSLPANTLQRMTTAEKKRLIEYHVVSGRAVDVDAQVAGTIPALSGDALNFSFGIDKIPLVNSAIVISEYTAKNGTVYLIDNVLLPPKKAPGTL